MKFSDFYSNTILLEGVNVGDVAEGIFAIAIGLQMAYGYVTPEMIRKARHDVDITGNKEVVIDSNVSHNPMFDNIVADPYDNIKIIVKIKLKQETVKGMFGPKIEQNKIIDKHINTLIEKIGNISAIDKIQRFMVSILTNKKPDEVVFYVVADGVSGSTSRGEIKGDVKLVIEAKTNTPIPKNLIDPISFSLKVDSDTISNLGIFSGILKLSQLFELDMTKGLEDLKFFPEKYNQSQDLLYNNQEKWDDENHIIYYLRKYLQIQDKYLSRPDDEFQGGSNERKSLQATDELEALKSLLERFLDEFERQLEGKDSEQFNADPRARLFTSRVSQFLEKEMFGKDLVDVIRISKGDIQEIKKSDLENLKNDYVINFKRDGNTMLFYSIDINNNRKLLFKIRPRFEFNPKGNRKTQLMMVELGDL